jgi:hypothetical protein
MASLAQKAENEYVEEWQLTATPISWIGYVMKLLDDTSECPSTQSDPLDTAPMNELGVVTKAP